MQYRRIRTPGASYFFTVNLHNRNSSLLTENIELLRSSFRAVKAKHPFHIDAMVVLPEHLHTIWTLPENDSDFSSRWMLIKASFSRGIRYTKPDKLRDTRVWQNRFWEHLIRNEKDFANHINYIHINPVKHGYVDRAVEWKYSSIHRYIQLGMHSQDWACEPDSELVTGERI